MDGWQRATGDFIDSVDIKLMVDNAQWKPVVGCVHRAFQRATVLRSNLAYRVLYSPSSRFSFSTCENSHIVCW